MIRKHLLSVQSVGAVLAALDGIVLTVYVVGRQ